MIKLGSFGLRGSNGGKVPAPFNPFTLKPRPSEASFSVIEVGLRCRSDPLMSMFKRLRVRNPHSLTAARKRASGEIKRFSWGKAGAEDPEAPTATIKQPLQWQADWNRSRGPFTVAELIERWQGCASVWQARNDREAFSAAYKAGFLQACGSVYDLQFRAVCVIDNEGDETPGVYALRLIWPVFGNRLALHNPATGRTDFIAMQDEEADIVLSRFGRL